MTDDDATPGRAPGIPTPRSRLSSSSMRRAAPLRSAGPQPPAAVVEQDAAVPEPPAPARSSRRGMALLVGGALLAVVAGGVLLQRTDGDRAEGPVAQAAAERTATRYPAPPITLGTDEELVDVDVLDGGDLVVTHWVRGAEPLTRLTLALPTGVAAPGAGIDVRDLVVAADDVLVASPVLGDTGWEGTLPEARDLYVTYRLSGALQRSGSVDGRALATVTSLTLGVGEVSLSGTRTFSSSKVLALGCLPPGARAVPTPCGMLVNDTWTLDVVPGAVPATVIAQIDLDATREGR